ncbi:transcriptional regulator [Actinoplanes sp. NBC_00393]|uniref:BTAD domain-containing putative transcriptional regulator n=1 Tax=Actinoplanes sp. NBC_00393 TaxID=2975953 RepID=UPI002E2142D0
MLLVAGALLVVPPWLLWQVSGNPITELSSWWTSEPFATDSRTAPAAGLRIALIWAGWLFWALLATLLIGSLLGVVRNRRLPRWRLPMSVHRLIFGLTGTATVAVVSTPAAAAIASPVPSDTAAAHAGPSTSVERAVREAIPPGLVARQDSIADTTTITVSTGQIRYEHRVRKGDTLSKVAKVWLRDPDRWGEICWLNKHRHFTTGTLTDCDLIYPGWELRLPADAVPPADAKPTAPKRPNVKPRPTPPRTSPTPAPTASVAATPPPSSDAIDHAEDTDDKPSAGADLVLPGGSVIPWTLASAISATAALVWLQRRRRDRPGSDENLQDLPAPVRAAQHHTHTTPPPAPPAETGKQRLPDGGVGLVGAGADSAARGLIVTALTSGTPAEPDQRAEVIIDRQTLQDLIGDAPLPGWPRLHITHTVDQALTLLDTRLLHRARIMDDHQLTDIGELRDAAPAEEALPPLTLITQAELAAPSSRARITFALTHDLDVTVIVLGHWPYGHNVSVADDGQTAPDADDVPDIGRLAVLDRATTRDLLATTREAHTGEPISSLPATSARSAERVPAAEPSATDASSAMDQRVRLRVFGPPQIENVVQPGRPLRRKAAELAVYLACHPDGADTDTLAEHLAPDARMNQARQQVHTNASNLRHVFTRAGGAHPNGYVIKKGASARYRLDPDTVYVDLWHFNKLVRRAQHAPPSERTELLEQACALAVAPLADGCDYEWITPHREQARRSVTEAHLNLAEHLLPDHPQQAATVLQQAIALDSMNEQLYRQAMRTSHALNDPDGIRTQLRALTRALNDIDAEPSEETIDLAEQLLGATRHPGNEKS